ncbi:hypothetical protein FA95DRAFT_1563171 [Auriscalpium vulgare]|uniref:Uncharacterized protein n=1 Tax=Auriscalpium vulgare TaxID=40419 RepID=A0ACB8RI32_9AGAM|nr:hypothetical protein FA95DRAFT_1563171 [Auriscalpium vulgare]
MLSFSSPPPFTPRRHISFTHTPHTSSPLASSAPSSPSPVARKTSGNRRAEYKSTAPALPKASSSSQGPSHAYKSRQRTSHGSGNLFTSASTDGTDSFRTAQRERFKQRCIDRAVRARKDKIAGKRRAMTSSDDGDMDMLDDEDEDEDFMLNDELFRRIIASANQKQRHSYRVSYELDVGSSLDPDLQDIAEIEEELLEEPSIPEYDDDVRPPSEFDEEELAAYAEDAAYWEDLEAVADDIFSLSDLEDEVGSGAVTIDGDVEMS